MSKSLSEGAKTARATKASNQTGSDQSQKKISIEEIRLLARHGLNQEAPVEKQVTHLTARFGDEQTPVAGGPMSRSVSGSGIRFMVRTNRVVRADRQPIQSAVQNDWATIAFIAHFLRSHEGFPAEEIARRLPEFLETDEELRWHESRYPQPLDHEDPPSSEDLPLW